MDGDTAPLRDLVALKERYGAWLMVDEAHATGLFGDKHRGWVEAQGVSDHVEVQMGTLSKALGSSGGYIAGSRPLIDWLVNRARSLIFSTAPSPVVSAASLAALQLIQSDEGATLKARLWKNVRAFSNEAVSPICPVLLGDEAQTCVAADMLRERGYWTPAIRYPTVARGQARLRITLSAQHTLTEIENLKDELGRLR
jgi:7-keto-8-aminopelargonate synthetase-like enzyme